MCATVTLDHEIPNFRGENQKKTCVKHCETTASQKNVHEMLRDFVDMKSRIWEKTIAPVWGSLWVPEVGVDVLFLGGE